MHAIAVVHQSGLNLPAAERRRVHTADLWRVKNWVQHPRDPGWDDGRYCKCHWQFRNAAARMTGEVVVDCVNDRKGKGYAVRSFFTVSKIAPCVHGKTLMFTDYYFCDREPYRLRRKIGPLGRRLTDAELDALRRHASYRRYQASTSNGPKSIAREDWSAMARAKRHRAHRRCCS